MGEPKASGGLQGLHLENQWENQRSGAGCKDKNEHSNGRTNGKTNFRTNDRTNKRTNRRTRSQGWITKITMREPMGEPDVEGRLQGFKIGKPTEEAESKGGLEESNMGNQCKDWRPRVGNK